MAGRLSESRTSKEKNVSKENRNIPPDLSRQPKYVQDYVEKIERERDTAIKALNEYHDDQSPSPFFVDDLMCLGEGKTGGPTSTRRYLPGVHRLLVNYKGVLLTIVLREKQIDLSWGDSQIYRGDIAMVPSGFQSAYLISASNMRIANPASDSS